MSSIKQLLELYAKQQMIPMHMPGHKRNPQIAPYLNNLSEQLDITEIDGFDNLHAPCGILSEAMEQATKVWQSDRSFFLVNGSTCGILAGIRALTRRGDKVLAARNCHKSVFHAIELCGLNPVFAMPPLLHETSIFGSILPEQIEKTLNQEPDVRLVIVTSPTYEGVISNLKQICEIAHKKGIPILVDEAHGAHLDLHPAFPGGAVKAGADITVQSLHKTLPSLTQTAILHVKGNRVDSKRLEHQLSVFETSSPSYLLMASIDGCIQKLSQNNFQLWADCLASFTAETAALQHLKIIGQTPEMFLHDPGKIIISTQQTNMTGMELTKELQKRHIQPEMTAPSYVLAMTGLGDTSKSIRALSSALLEIDRKCTASPAFHRSLLPSCPNILFPPEQALEQEFEFIPLHQAEGRIAAEYVWAYPPGIPLLLPGEQIHLPLAEMPLHSTRGALPQTIAVLKSCKRP